MSQDDSETAHPENGEFRRKSVRSHRSQGTDFTPLRLSVKKLKSIQK